MSAMTEFWLLAWPVAAALLAVGAVLAIKITRRREATEHPAGTDLVPALPLSAADARKMVRRYFITVAVILAGGAALGLAVSSAS